MIRKIFAFLFLLVFVVSISLLLILQSISSSLLNKDELVKDIVPSSFDTVIPFIAFQFAQQPDDKELFASRIRSVLDQQTYSDIAGAFIASVSGIQKSLEEGGRLEINLMPVKEKIKQVLPDILKKLPVCSAAEKMEESFRFCVQGNMIGPSFESNVKEVITAEIPATLSFVQEGNPEVNRLFRLALFIQKKLPAIIAGLSIFLLSAIALFIFSPWTSVVAWIGGAALALAGFLALFAAVFYQLPEISNISQNLASPQLNTIIFLINQPLRHLKLWIYFIAAFGILAVGLSIVLKNIKKGEI